MKKIVCLLSIIVCLLSIIVFGWVTEQKKVVLSEKKEQKKVVVAEKEQTSNLTAGAEELELLILPKNSRFRAERERQIQEERAERERIAQEEQAQGGWINFATANTVPNQKCWYDSDAIFIVYNKVTFVHIVMCNKQPKKSYDFNNRRLNPLVELTGGAWIKGDWVGFEKREGIWTWSIDNSMYNPIVQGSVLEILLQSLPKSKLVK